MRIRFALGAFLTIGFLTLGASLGISQSRESKSFHRIRQFLREYWAGFELSSTDKPAALKRMEDDMSDDFTAAFYIPKQSKELSNYDKKGILTGLSQAFDRYHGKQPAMRIRKVIVLPRSETEAVASFELDFYLQGRLRNVALCITDLRKVDGKWKIYRLYEDKQS